MKKFATLMLFLSLGLFSVGCNKPAEKGKETPKPPMEDKKVGDDAAPAGSDKPAGDSPDEPAKDGDSK